MGRLDDRAKRRIVELRRAGLSFRKIKKVLELDDIRVTPQAVYLFLKRRSVELGPAAAGWDSDQPWPLLQGHAPEPSKVEPSAGPTGSQVPCPTASQDTKMGIQIVSVVSLCQDGRQLREVLPVGLPSGNGNDDCKGTSSASGSCPTPGGPTTLPQPLPSQGQLVTPPAQNSALMVKEKMVGRTILLQKKVKDVSVQTAQPNPTSPGNQNCACGEPALPPAPSSQAIAEKLDAVQREMQKLNQALQVLLERQCRLERQQEQQQEQQQRLQQEVLVTLQQLSSTVSHGAVPANQPCVPFSSMTKPSPAVPNFSQFKMELI